MVRTEGLEPTHLSAPDPKSGASANFATSAVKLLTEGDTSQKRIENQANNQRKQMFFSSFYKKYLTFMFEYALINSR